jgi:CDP-diacylglycerol--glycerol-3-phosphate 3-phosphatidyltransferase
MKTKLKLEWTIPNILTTIRLLAIPVMAIFIFRMRQGQEHEELSATVAFVFFVAIWLTDLADGYIARKYDMVSEFGKIYDPFVDKLFQFTTAFMMLLIGRIPLWVVMFILVKEIVMILGGAFVLQQMKLVVMAKWYGKASTVLFVMALASLFFLTKDTLYYAHFIFIPPVLMSTFSTVRYAMNAIVKFNEMNEDNPEDVSSGQNIS